VSGELADPSHPLFIVQALRPPNLALLQVYQDRVDNIDNDIVMDVCKNQNLVQIRFLKTEPSKNLTFVWTVFR